MSRVSALLFLLAFAGCSPVDRSAIAPLTYNPISPYKFSCTPIDSLYIADHLDELEADFGNDLKADAYRDKLLAALAFYPRLRGVHIELVHQRLRTSMAARPLRLGADRARRRYAILVDDVSERASDFRKSSYSAQVGCFIHELGHVSHYERTANADLVAQGMAYVTNQDFKSRYEAIADSFVVVNGGAYYLSQYRTFTFEEADLPPEYLAFKRRNYNGPEDVLRQHRRYIRKKGWPLPDDCDH